jgi:recombination protein RecA
MKMAKETKEKGKILNLEDFTKEIKKLCGKDSIIDANDKEAYGDVIPTTSFSLSNSLGIGGIAKRKIYTIDGDLSSGKSTTAYDIIGQCQKKYGEQCLLIDKEDSYTKEYGTQLGINNDLLTIITPHTLEDMYEVVIKALDADLFGVIVVDSVTSFAPAARFEGSVVMGIEARVNSDKMRLVADAISRSNTTLILLQQIRNTIGGMGDPTVVSGGKAIPFYAHVRIRITRSEIDRVLCQNIMKFTIIKNKMAPPFKVGTVVYKWGVGFDFFSEISELAIEFGIIKQEKTSYFPPGIEEKFVGKKKLIEFLNNNEEYTRTVLQPLVKEQLAKTDAREEEEVLSDKEYLTNVDL